MTEVTTASPVERDEYTAKQVATRIGTDSKTLRKFFRSPSSTVEPVGQGGRYIFDAADLPKIKAEFDKWNSTKSHRGPKSEGQVKGRRQAPRNAQVVEEDYEVVEIEEEDDLLEDPTEEDLADLLEEEDDIDLEDLEEL